MAEEFDNQGLLDNWHDTFRESPDYVAEGMALRVAEQIARLMAGRGITRAELAARMGVSPAFVSRTLNAPPNMTLRTIAAFAIALGVEPAVAFGEGGADADSGKPHAASGEEAAG